MPYKYNPLLGIGLDEVGTGSGGTTPPAGSDTQIQFNDGGAFGGDAGLTYNKTTDELTVAGDINLDDGGTFSTTVQSVTPTANRTISFPDATGTVALVSGANGTIQYNDAGTLKGNSDFTVDVDWDNPSTTFTALKVNVPDATQGAADSNLLDLQVGGVSRFKITNQSVITGSYFIAGTNAALGVEYFQAPNLYTGNRVSVGIAGVIGWTSGTPNLANDLTLFRDDAGILAQRNDTAAQTYRLYNTYTDASNFERTSITRDSSGLVIDAQKGGTGADPTNLLDVKLDGTSKFSVKSTGTGLFSAGGHDFLSDANAIVLTNSNGIRSFVSRSDFSILPSNSSLKWGNLSSFATDTGLARDSAGVVKVTDGSTGTGYLKLIPTTVGALTAAATVGAGTKAFVTDSTSTLSSHHGQAVVGGGNNFVPVFSDGTNWIVG